MTQEVKRFTQVGSETTEEQRRRARWAVGMWCRARGYGRDVALELLDELGLEVP